MNMLTAAYCPECRVYLGMQMPENIDLPRLFIMPHAAYCSRALREEREELLDAMEAENAWR